MLSGEEVHAQIIAEFRADPWNAHAALFARRHPDKSPVAHTELVAAIYRPVARLSIEGFRGFAKSTYLEEAACIKAGFRDFRNMVIVAASYSRAVDRLSAIKRELEINDDFIQAFGVLRGDTWQEGKIVLRTGACIQAIGRDQSMVGIKHFEWRPDAALVDDVEDPDEVRTDADRAGTWDWFQKTFIPSLDHPERSWVRVLGTRRGNGSLPQRLEEEVRWPCVKFPIEFKDPVTGMRRATWPAKFPLSTIDKMLFDYRRDMHTFAQEFMCQATSEQARIFTREMFRVEPRERTWQPVYAFIDPARSTGRKAATTGWAAWSWIAERGVTRLVVWAAGALTIMPDEIVALAFDICERFSPVWLGVERDGLEQWLLQPLRQEQVRRGISIPYRGIAAVSGTRGGGQVRFIEGLQPFFAAHEVIFAQPLPELEDQLLSFPHGPRDAPNALAYAMTMRPGAAIYEGFTADHIVENLRAVAGHKVFLAANATGAVTTAVLLQAFDGRLRILADWVVEGPPAERAEEIAVAAALAADPIQRVAAPREWDDMLNASVPDRMLLRRLSPEWVVAPAHDDRHTNVGLVQAIRALPAEVRFGAANAGTLPLAQALERTRRGVPAVEISETATWTIRALAGGYTRALVRGRLQEHAEDGPYRTLMEGLESFVGLIARYGQADEEDEEGGNYRVDPSSGRRYLSAIPQRRA